MRPAAGFRRPRAVLAAVAACAPGQGLAQPTALDRPALNQPSGALPSRFQRVEQTIGDVDPLGISIRHFSADLRQPTGFREVFRIAGSGAASRRLGIPNPTGADLFARVDGAVTAVFPQSVYIETRNGTVALIPPGTIFFIGELPFDRFAEPEEEPELPTKVDLRVESRVEPSSGAPAALDQRPREEGGRKRETERVAVDEEKEEIAAPSLMTDESVRRSAVRELIMRAAGAPGPKGAGTGAPEQKGAAPKAPEGR